MSSVPPKSKVLIVGLGVGAAACVFLLATVASVAIPAFLKNRYKSKQNEAKYMLKILLTKEQEFRTARGHWATTPREMVEFVNSAPRSSTCFLGPSAGWGGNRDVKLEQLPVAVRERLSANVEAVAAQKSKSNVDADLLIACVVNLDDDDDVDVWTITASDPTPRHDFSDLGE